eukprot:gene911-1426_t
MEILRREIHEECAWNVFGAGAEGTARRGATFWSAGLLLRTLGELESLALIPNAMYAPAVHATRASGPTSTSAVIALTLSGYDNGELVFPGNREGVLMMKYDAKPPHCTARDFRTRWQETKRSGSIVRVFLHPKHAFYARARDWLLDGAQPPSRTEEWWLYAADMEVVEIGNEDDVVTLRQDAPAQEKVLRAVRSHAERHGHSPPDSCEPLIYLGAPSLEECALRPCEDSGAGIYARQMAFTLPMGGKQNLHADGNGQEADTLLAILGVTKKERGRAVPSAVFMVADAAAKPFEGEYVLIPCIPGMVVTLAGLLANGGDGRRRTGAVHGKLPVMLAAEDEAAPHLVMSCKRFKLVEGRPDGAAALGVQMRLQPKDLRDPLRHSFYRRFITGRVARSDAYPPSLEVLQREQFLWEPPADLAGKANKKMMPSLASTKLIKMRRKAHVGGHQQFLYTWKCQNRLMVGNK